MNIIITITTVALRGQNAERELKTTIEKYLHRMNIVDDSKTLALLRRTVTMLKKILATKTLIVDDSTLHKILQRMQSTIEQLQKKNDRFKIKNYTKILRIAFESRAISINKSINSKATKQIREFTIIIFNEKKKNRAENDYQENNE